MKNELIKTGKNYFATLKNIQKGYRMTTAAEEMKIAWTVKTQGDIKRLYFYPDNTMAWIWTNTALRKPTGITKIVKNGKIYYRRLVIVGNKIVGTIKIPEGNGKIITKWNSKFGLPLETTETIPGNIKEVHTHFWFNPIMNEVAVERGSCGALDVGEKCLDVIADGGRLVAIWDDGFRLVQDPLKIDKHKHKFVCGCGRVRE